MYGLKVKKEDAQDVKLYLMEKSLLHEGFKVKQYKDHIIFPVRDVIKTKKGTLVSETFKAYPDTDTDMKALLEDKLSKDELELLQTSFDVVGSIAIIKIPDELRLFAKDIAKAVLKTAAGVQTVLEKTGKVSGVHRTPELSFLHGKKTFETTHTEYGVKIRLDVSTVYFSPRLGNERKRIADQVEEGEDVCVMFSGCGPYNLVIQKHSNPKSVIGIEINPNGHKFALENKRINKMPSLKFYLGDVTDVMPSFERSFDRILMPLPESSEAYLSLAINSAKPEATIHVYKFLNEDDVDAFKQTLLEETQVKQVENVVICGDRSPGVHRYCFDVRIQ